MSSLPARLRAKGIRLAYGAQQILSGVDLEIASGAIVVVIGENGSGKTTLINVLSGFAPAMAGVLEVDGARLVHPTPEKCSAIGMIRTFQEPRVFEQMTVMECLMLASYGGKSPPLWMTIAPGSRVRRAEDHHRSICHALLARMGWGDLRDVMAGTLSYGQRKLLGIAQAYLTPCTIMLLDEPVAGLDGTQATFVIRLLQEWIAGDERRCILATTHELRALRPIANQILRLSAGKLHRQE